jgi:hypothetical protein
VVEELKHEDVNWGGDATKLCPRGTRSLRRGDPA